MNSCAVDGREDESQSSTKRETTNRMESLLELFPHSGILMPIITAVFSSMHFIAQEQLFTSYSASALEGASFVGLFGTVIDLVIVLVAHCIGYEDLRTTFYQISSNQHESRVLLTGKNYIGLNRVA